VVVSGARIYAKMMQKNPDLADCVVVVQQAFESWDGSLPELPKGWESPRLASSAETGSVTRAGDAAAGGNSIDEQALGASWMLSRFDLVHASIWRLSRCFAPGKGGDGDAGGGDGASDSPVADEDGGPATPVTGSAGAAPGDLVLHAKAWQTGPMRKP